MKVTKMAVIAALLVSQAAHAGQQKHSDAELKALIDQAIDDSVVSAKTETDVRRMSIMNLRIETELLLSKIESAQNNIDSTKTSRNIKLAITAGLAALTIRAARSRDYQGSDLAQGFAAMFKVMKVLALGGVTAVPGTLAATDQMFILMDTKEVGKLKTRLAEIRKELLAREAALK